MENTDDDTKLSLVHALLQYSILLMEYFDLNV